MVVTYDVSTPYIGDAREMAVRRARAEGWRSALVISTYPSGPGTFVVTMTVVK